MTSAHTSAPLDFPLGDQVPGRGTALEVAPGVLWLRMGLPFALDHINLWLLRDALPDAGGALREGWTLVDCGIDNPQTREDWGRIEAEVLQGLPILRVLVTHMHPDHIGLAHHLCERWQAPLWISTSEYQAACMASSGQSNFGGEQTLRHFSAHGWTDPQALDQIRARVDYYPSMVPRVPATHVRWMDAQRVHIGKRTWRCRVGHGHSPEHIALMDEDGQLLISGDMLLPSISTNVSVYAQEPEGNALQWFLDSLDRMANIPDATLVLPAHGRPFRGALARIRQLQAHHEDRLQALMQLCRRRAVSAHDALPVLFKRELNLHQTTFAMGEAIAHLHVLWHRGEVRRALGGDGVWRFSADASEGRV